MNEMAKVKEVLASLQQSSQSRSSSSPHVSALHSTSQILAPTLPPAHCCPPTLQPPYYCPPTQPPTYILPILPAHLRDNLQSGVPQMLLPVQEVLDRNKNLVRISRAGKLSIKLVKEALFGEEVMRQCTPNSMRGLPALPKE